jgi:hypothetical protein
VAAWLIFIGGIANRASIAAIKHKGKRFFWPETAGKRRAVKTGRPAEIKSGRQFFSAAENNRQKRK